MAVIIQTGVSPVSIECAAEAIYEGKVYKDNGSGQMTICTKSTDTAQAVAIEATIDPVDGTAKTLEAGAGASFAPLGSGMIVGVVSDNTMTWSFGALVYVSDVVNGNVSTATSSAKCIGTYWGKDTVVTSNATTIISVKLDRAPGATA